MQVKFFAFKFSQDVNPNINTGSPIWTWTYGYPVYAWNAGSLKWLNLSNELLEAIILG